MRKMKNAMSASSMFQLDGNRRFCRFYIAFSFSLFLFVVCHKLLNASLWYDEAIEYWFSKVMFGPLPYEEAAGSVSSTNMYQRIISTYQPPLYNVLMWLWLRLWDGELWFRFSGVVFGMLGMAGLYHAVKLAAGSTVLSCLAVNFATFTWRLVYYYQECAEYALLLTSLFWMMYFFIRLEREPTSKNALWLCLSAVLSVYSQYGAAFPVAVFLLLAYVIVLMEKKKALFRDVTAIYGTVAIVFALPLIWFFLLPQLRVQRQMRLAEATSASGSNPIQSPLEGLLTVVRWCFGADCAGWVVASLLAAMLAAMLVACVWGRRRLCKMLVGANVAVFALYCLAVATKVYAHGHGMYFGFGNRYNLFFIPLWIVLVFALMDELPCAIARFGNSGGGICPGASVWAGYLAGFSVCAVICHSIVNWECRLSANWPKECVRQAVERWQENCCEKHPTLVSRLSSPAFCYYLRHGHPNASEGNVLYCVGGTHLLGKDYLLGDGFVASEFAEWFNAAFPKPPPRLFLFESHNGNIRNGISTWLMNRGYARKELYPRILYAFTYDRFAKVARIDVRNVGTASNTVEVVFCSDAENSFTAPSWLAKEDGRGRKIQSDALRLSASFRCIGKGTLSISLRGVDFKGGDKRRIPMRVDFTRLEVNGRSVLDTRTTVWHDKPYEFRKEVEDGEIVTFHAEWCESTCGQ